MRDIKLGIVGLGQRGSALLGTLKKIENAKIVALCDLYEDRLDKAYSELEESGVNPTKYGNFEEFLKDKEVEAVFICTSWKCHVRMAVECMKAGKKVAMEVGGARTIDECFELVSVYEQTKTPFFFLENWFPIYLPRSSSAEFFLKLIFQNTS